VVVRQRGAFTLIELIFAIVIIAIAVLALPMMNKATTKNTEQSIVQEAIFAAVTELDEATSAYWDDNSIDPSSPNSYARVIDVDGLCENNSSSSRYRYMVGHVVEPLHRRCLDDNTTTPANADVNSSIESLDDKEHTDQNLLLNPDGSSAGYKQIYKASLEVTPNANFGGSNNNNIKKLQLIVKDENGKNICLLNTYSANIGEVDFYKKEY
jgi:prepilin-type N-terminal cleavage/methylation domain-containing protein